MATNTDNPQLVIKSGRATLKLLRRDINQMYSVGQSVVDGSQANLLPSFLAMYPSLSSLQEKYMSSFNSYLSLAIIAGEEKLFPTDEDIKQRTEINSLFYKIVENYQLCQKKNDSVRDSSKVNQSMISKSRLPKISLPRFSGTISEWPKYKQLFDSMVNSNIEIPVIERFHYLSTSLLGEALTSIASFTLNEENYYKAWDSLCKRYDNKRLLASSYVNKILDFTQCKSPPTISSLQSFIANVGENVAALKSVEISNESDFVWLTLALRKLDPETRKQFEVHCVDIEWPTFKQLVDFIHGRCKVLQLSECSDFSRFSRPSKTVGKSYICSAATSASSINKQPCYCRQSHPLVNCPTFLSKSPAGRKSFLKGKIICHNCLRVGHISPDCTSLQRCQACKGKHHTLLHWGTIQQQISNSEQPLTSDKTTVNEQYGSNSGKSSSVIASVKGHTRVLLGTITAFILDNLQTPQPVRVLVDCGSHFSLITSQCAKRLGLSWESFHLNPIGACETPLPKIKRRLNCKLKSRVLSQTEFNVQPLVVNTIMGMLPSTTLNPISDTCPEFQQLADPKFWEPNQIDFLLGGDLFIKTITGVPITVDNIYDALPTAFGLVVMGPIDTTSNIIDNLHCYCLTEAPISEEIITRFWETEEVFIDPLNSKPDPCEEHYSKTHCRDSSGRYVVSLPFKESPCGLESSMSLARIQYQNLERRMNKNPSFKDKYNAFLQEYLDLGHMALAKIPSAYVIPHHGVFKSNDPNSKIRVVFNASARTPNGSLNDKLYIGPKLQKDLTIIILKFRCHRIAITADLIKMYRQILVRPEDCCFQHILWRRDSSKPIEVFEVKTVTQGVASAPFHALRTISQLVKDEGKPFPLAANILSEDIYVDDIATGADTIDNALLLKDQLITLLGKGHFEIHKWASNSKEFLQSFSSPEECLPLSLSPKDSSTTKILGMSWDPMEDTFFFQVHKVTPGVTKRIILSVISRLFDPMGYLAPVIFKAKTILQQLWQSHTDWDDKPDNLLVIEWLAFSNHLQHLNDLRIPRYLFCQTSHSVQVLGFCDASQKGFAAAVYLRVISSQGNVKVSLLKAKTKLAPLKTISVPRLELSGAHLLVKLLLSIKSFLDSLLNSNIYLFTDSTIVLAWLKISQWFHVTSADNPADLASRGIAPDLLHLHSLWWAGPTWLQEPDWTPSAYSAHCDEVPELRNGATLVFDSSVPALISFISSFSNYYKMLRVLAYVKRFIFNLKNSTDRNIGPLTTIEINAALMTCIKITKTYEFKQDFSWSEDRPVSKRLQILAAYSDSFGIIRVGGRLQNSDLSESTKFPIILPGNCHLMSLLITHLHEAFFHLGFQALQAMIRRKYWIFRLRQSIKCQLSKCLVCFKMRARPQPPIMGNLPTCRVVPSKVFAETGIDFAGPFNLKLSNRKNAPTCKAYLCIFICMSTRAVHLEYVSSLSTDAFFAAFERFVSRRSCPRAIYSDCGTNFVGAERRLKELFFWLNSNETTQLIQEKTVSRGIQWHFNPPLAPHFGGIWEAAVKSAKRHLYRVTKNRIFLLEELITLFSKIEAILNSRPLCLMQEDTSQGDVLTPGHFLVGSPLIALPEQDHTQITINRLSRWQLVSNITQHFWKRWHSEYLQTLQKRPKWYTSSNPLNIGNLVLVADPRSPPLQWKLARIVEVHPGNDGIIRVVTIQDNHGCYKRSVNKLVSLSHLQES